MKFSSDPLAAGCILAQEQTPNDQTPQDPDQTYQGPSVLSRNKGLIGERGGKLLDFRYCAEVTGIYDSGTVSLANGAAIPANEFTSAKLCPTMTDKRVVYAPLVEARLMRRFDRSSLTLDYPAGASQGNGVYLTSRQIGGTVGYSYTGVSLSLPFSPGDTPLAIW